MNNKSIQIKKDELYLVTGGSGFLGKELIGRLLKGGSKVRVVARNEGNLILLKQRFPQIEYFTGDIAQSSICAQVIKDVDGIFHLAAFKHVGMAEYQPKECVMSNIVGSLNLLEESLHEKSIKFFVAISTDKAAQVAGVYGASKYLMEHLIKQFSSFDESKKYRILRYGNVLYSTGSVLCKWKDLLKEGKEVVVTDQNATRFFWTIEQAVDLIYECMDKATNCSPFAPDMKSIRLRSLLSAMASKYLPHGAELKVKEIGLQPGENLHEKIMEEGPYSNEVEEYTVNEIMELI